MLDTTIVRASLVLLMLSTLDTPARAGQGRAGPPLKRTRAAPVRAPGALRLAIDVTTGGPLRQALRVRVERLGYVVLPGATGGRPPGGLYVSGRVTELRHRPGEVTCAVDYALFHDAHLRWHAVASAQVTASDAQAEFQCLEALAEQMAEQLSQAPPAR